MTSIFLSQWLCHSSLCILSIILGQVNHSFHLELLSTLVYYLVFSGDMETIGYIYIGRGSLKELTYAIVETENSPNWCLQARVPERLGGLIHFNSNGLRTKRTNEVDSSQGLKTWETVAPRTVEDQCLSSFNQAGKAQIFFPPPFSCIQHCLPSHWEGQTSFLSPVQIKFRC